MVQARVDQRERQVDGWGAPWLDEQLDDQTEGRGEVDMAATAALMADPSRAAMLDILSDGRALPAGELARVAGVSAQTASAHLSRLLAGGMVVVIVQGRHRYYRMASADVATAVEAVARISPPRQVRSLRESRRAAALRMARTCYDHVAGELGVALLDSLVARDWLVAAEGGGYQVTGAGDAGFDGFGLDMATVRASRRMFARPCLDWTERRAHLSGALGAALCVRLLDLKWLVRRGPTERGLRLTDDGRSGLAETFGVTVR
ncbi:MAG: ArsR/SmtB family transcription factor [Mycobacteriales bacterium]